MRKPLTLSKLALIGSAASGTCGAVEREARAHVSNNNWKRDDTVFICLLVSLFLFVSRFFFSLHVLLFSNTCSELVFHQTVFTSHAGLECLVLKDESSRVRYKIVKKTWRLK